MHGRIYGHIWGQQWGIHTRIYGPLLLLYRAHSCPHIWPVAALVYGPFLPPYMARYCSCIWPILAPIYGPLLLLYMAHSYPHKLYIASAKRLVQIRYKAWRFLIAFRIVLIFVPLNGAYIRAYMGHTGAAMGHVCAHI